MTCPGCDLPEPADYCWPQRYDCPLGFPPRDIDVRALLRLIVDLQNRVAALENHPLRPRDPDQAPAPVKDQGPREGALDSIHQPRK